MDDRDRGDVDLASLRPDGCFTRGREDDRHRRVDDNCRRTAEAGAGHAPSVVFGTAVRCSSAVTHGPSDAFGSPVRHFSSLRKLTASHPHSAVRSLSGLLRDGNSDFSRGTGECQSLASDTCRKTPYSRTDSNPFHSDGLYRIRHLRAMDEKTNPPKPSTHSGLERRRKRTRTEGLLAAQQ